MKRSLILVFLSLLLILPLMAQDGTAVPLTDAPVTVVTVATAESTEPAAPTCAEGSTCVFTSPDQPTPASETPPAEPAPWWASYAAFVAVLLTLIAGGRSLLHRLDEWLKIKAKDPVFMTRGEGGATLLPAAAKEGLLGAIDDGLSVGRTLRDIVGEWFDKTPFVSKPPKE